MRPNRARTFFPRKILRGKNAFGLAPDALRTAGLASSAVTAEQAGLSSAAISRLAAVPCTLIDLDLARAARRARDTRALAHLLTVTHEISDRVSPPAWWARPLLVARRRRLIRQTLRGE